MERQRANTKVSPKEKRLAEVASVLFWLYLLVKLFIFDIDNYLLRTYYPSLSSIIDYKFFIFLALLVVLLFILGTKKFFKFLAFVLGYPFFILFWRLPKLLFGNKNWMGLFVALGTSVSFFKSFRLNMAISAAVLFAGLFILIADSKNLLIISMLVLSIYLVIHFVRRFSYSLKKFDVVTRLSKKVLDFWTRIQETQTDTQKQSASSESIEKKEADAKANRLQWLLVFNRGCLFLISKLRYMQKSASTFVYYFINLIGSAFVTVVVFLFLNLGLNKIDHNAFSIQGSARTIDFFFYSCGLFFGGLNSGINAVSDPAKILYIAEICFRWLIVVILFYFLFNVVRKKHKSDIDTSITHLREQGAELEKVIAGEYQLSVDEAVEEVTKVKGSMLVLINYLISHIDLKQD
jgi:hypothetical protein